MTHSSPSLSGRTIVVTGASSGIGRAAAIELGRAGAQVVVVGRHPGRVEETCELVRASHSRARVFGVCGDVRRWPDMEAMAAQARDHFGGIDGLVTSAGTSGTQAQTRGVPFAAVQLPIEEWDEVIDTNLTGTIFSIRAVLPTMIDQGEGDIILVSSARSARRGEPYALAYCASKHGIMALSDSLQQNLEPHGIRIQTLLPDVVDTPMMQLAKHLAPQGTLKPEAVGRLIVEMISLPPDAVWREPLLTPRLPFAATA
jgi:3-oxoacyl-[acyl-carrier protein] reductase